jgi:hypothetical protein
MKSKRINYFFFSLGLLSFISFIGVTYVITERRNTRINGVLTHARITGYYGRISRPKGGFNIEINNKKYYTEGFDESYTIGDSIPVRYIEDNNEAIQERKNPNRYYFYYILNLFLLLPPSYLLIKESLKGKSTWEYRTTPNEVFKERLKKKFNEFLKNGNKNKR